MANNPIDVIVKTKPMSEPRRVVTRPRTATNTTASRAATTTSVTASPSAARNTTTPNIGTNQKVNRRVVARRATSATGNARSTTDTTTTTTVLGGSNSQCLSNYMNCMDGYCARENMAYNRCFCSAKLAQIDSKYQPMINDMMTQIVTLRAGSAGNWTEEEMNEYWMERIGNYTGTNSWANLDAALNIEWPTADERTRGQNAFLTGHEYCVQHLRACAYMSSNMRDAYRSQISRDCNTYENALIKIKTAAESMIEYYSE